MACFFVGFVVNVHDPESHRPGGRNYEERDLEADGRRCLNRLIADHLGPWERDQYWKRAQLDVLKGMNEALPAGESSVSRVVFEEFVSLHDDSEGLSFFSASLLDHPEPRPSFWEVWRALF